MQILDVNVDASEPFTLRGQVTLFAKGLQGADKVIVEIVTITRAGPSGDVCCPGTVVLPEVQDTVPLIYTCGCEERPVELTAAKPWAVLDAPQQVPLRAVKDVGVGAAVSVELFEGTTSAIVTVR